MYHNDYTVLVKEYLNRYNEFKQYVANVEAEIEDYKEMLKLSAVPKVPSLSPAGGCGGGDRTSPQERAYFKQEDLEKRLEDSYQDLLEVLPKVRKLDRSLDALKATNPVDYRIIHARYRRLVLGKHGPLCRCQRDLLPNGSQEGTAAADRGHVRRRIHPDADESGIH